MPPKKPTAPDASAFARAGVCAAVALLMYWACAGALFRFAAGAQTAVAVGVTAGLIGGVWVAAGSTTLAMLVGLATGPSSIWFANQAGFQPVQLVWVVLGAAVAAGVATIVQRRLVDPRWLLWAVVALLIANAWATMYRLDSQPLNDARTHTIQPPLVSLLEGASDPALQDSDGYLYAWVITQVRGGEEYYAAFANARPTLIPGMSGPTSVLNFRQPLLYRFLALGGSGWWVLGTLMLLVSAAAASVLVLLHDVVRAPVALPGVAAVLTYALANVISLNVLYAEFWAGPLLLIAAALLAWSQRTERWKAATIAAAVVVVIAFLIREFALFALLAGFGAAWFGPAKRRGFSLAVWGTALVAAAAGYGAHVIAALPHLSHAAATTGTEGFALLQGGPAFALAGFTYSTHVFAFPFALGDTIPLLLATLGLVGAARLAGRSQRIFVLGFVALFVLGELVAGNGAWDVATGAPINPWAQMVLFLVYGCVPAALALVPVARPHGAGDSVRAGGFAHPAGASGARKKARR